MFREVCTRPGKSTFMAWTPWGMDSSVRSMPAVASGDSAPSSALLSQARAMPSSQPVYSFFNAAPDSWMKASNSPARSAGRATLAWFREQITLSNRPPRISASRRPGTRSRAPYSTRPITWLAEARPLWISPPEWPPRRPSREIS